MALGDHNLCLVFVQYKNFFVRKARRRVGRVVDLKVPIREFTIYDATKDYALERHGN
jgi:hypothetical protein